VNNASAPYPQTNLEQQLVVRQDFGKSDSGEMSACVHFDSYLRFRICYCVVCKFSKFSLQQHLSYLFGMIKYATTDCRWCRHWCTLISIYANQYKTVCFVKKTNLVRQFRWDITWVNSRTQTHAVEVIKESFVVFDLVNRHHAHKLKSSGETWNKKMMRTSTAYHASVSVSPQELCLKFNP